MTAVAADLGQLVERRSTGPVVPLEPSESRKPSRILRLLSVIVNSGTPAAASAAWITWAVSASATGLSVPIVSKSHWTNSRNRPLAGRSPRNTEPIAYALERHAEFVDVLGDEPGQGHGQVEPQGELAGRASFVGDLEDLPEHLVGAGPLAGQDLHPLDVGVSIGRNPNPAKVWRNVASIRSRGIITAGAGLSGRWRRGGRSWKMSFLWGFRSLWTAELSSYFHPARVSRMTKSAQKLDRFGTVRWLSQIQTPRYCFRGTDRAQ